jgi:ABC-type multidrug transport system ATPase subunit
MAGSDMILDAREICKSYGTRAVLRGVSLSCRKGEIAGLIGPNGAGKSTLFRILLGLVSRDSGQLVVHSQSAKPLGGIIEKPALYNYLSAYDNLRVFSRIQGLDFDRKAYEGLMERVGLAPGRKDPVRNYSMGMKQRLGLAVALLNSPECVILDEPFSGLDPIGIRSLQARIRSLAREQHMAILLSSHNLVELGDLCDSLSVINHGEIVRHGPANEVFGQAVGGYLLYGTGFQHSRLLKEVGAEVGNTAAMLTLNGRGISEILRELSAEQGVAVSACIPQTNLNALFEKQIP